MKQKYSTEEGRGTDSRNSRKMPAFLLYELIMTVWGAPGTHVMTMMMKSHLLCFIGGFFSSCRPTVIYANPHKVRLAASLLAHLSFAPVSAIPMGDVVKVPREVGGIGEAHG